MRDEGEWAFFNSLDCGGNHDLSGAKPRWIEIRVRFVFLRGWALW